jgi:DNA-binding winged helix-turn-helix (wHTH) protein
MEGAFNQRIVRAGDLEIRPAEFIAMASGRRLNLTVRELELLTALAERSNRIVSREELYRVVWGERYRKSDRSVDVYVGKLRQKLQAALPGRRFIHTHFGFGYRFSPEERSDPALFTPFSQRRDSSITDSGLAAESVRRDETNEGEDPNEEAACVRRMRRGRGGRGGLWRR